MEENRSGKRLSNKELIDRFYRKCPKIKIISLANNADGECLLQCNDCGGVYRRKRKELVSASFGCAICSNHQVCIGINDINTTAPWMNDYIVDNDYSYTHMKNSGTKTKMKCPNCGYEKILPPTILLAHGFGCPICSDGVSFPNKLARAILKQLPVINVKYEYSASWTNRKSYDNYFEYDSQAYFLEMDGGFHYTESKFKNGMTLADVQTNDKIKDELARQHNIKVIRIDCKKSDFNYIHKSIMDSLLNELFNLSEIDWAACVREASASLVVKVWDYYKDIPNSTLKQIGSVFGISTNTAMRYLKRGDECGIIEYNHGNKRLQKAKVIRIGNHVGIKGVITTVYDKNNNLVGEYPSTNYAVKQLSEIYDIAFSRKAIEKLKYKNKNAKSIEYKGFVFYFKSRKEA